MMAMRAEEIVGFVRTHYADVCVDEEDWGEFALMYRPEDSIRKRGFYFVTIKSQDTDRDKVSCLGPDRKRFSVVVSRKAYRERFGAVKRDPAKVVVTDERFDFMAEDVVVPDPTGWIAVSVLNPSSGTFERLKPLLDDGHALCAHKHALELKRAGAR